MRPDGFAVSFDVEFNTKSFVVRFQKKLTIFSGGNWPLKVLVGGRDCLSLY